MFGDVIRRRCEELGLTQTELADRVGVHVRQIRRYERGEQQPVLGVAAKLAATLGVSLDELAGAGDGPLDGEWWSARQIEVEGRVLIATVPVTLRRRGDAIVVEGRGWRGELRVWEDERTLTGWYGGTGAPGDDVLRAGAGRDERDGALGDAGRHGARGTGAHARAGRGGDRRPDPLTKGL